MKIYVDAKKEKVMEGVNTMYGHGEVGRTVPSHEHREMGTPIPLHERKALMRVEMDEMDMALLRVVFGDKDTAEAAAEIIREAPPEIQILAIQLINIIGEVA